MKLFFKAALIILISYIALAAYANYGITRNVQACYWGQLTSLSETNKKTTLTTPEMKAVLDYAVECAEQRSNVIERLFFNVKRARGVIKVTLVRPNA
jgi:hypothetical protein